MAVQAGEAGVHQRGDFRFEVAPEPDYVEAREVPAAWDAEAPGASGATWRTWLYDRQVDRRGKAASVFTDYAYEAVTPATLGDAGKYQISFNPLYQQLRIHRVRLRRDGRWHDRLQADHVSLARRERGFEEDLSDGMVTALIVLDDVRPGDVVRIAYTVEGSNPILAGQDSDTMYFGWQSPVLDSWLRVLDDPGTVLEVQRENGAPAASRNDSADGAEVELHAHGMPATVDESDYPVWYQPFPRAQVSARRSWADVVAWAEPLYPAVTDPLPEDLEALVGQWSRLATKEQQLTAALRAVQDEVRYFGVEMGDNTHKPVPPADTWRRRRGDCKDKAYLLTTILNRLGIPSVPALASIDEGRAIQDRIPSAYVFDHVIVRSMVDGKPAWIDPTIRLQGGSAVESDLSRYGVVLPVEAGSAGLEQVLAPKDSDAGVEVVETYQPGADGRDVPLEIRTTYKGNAADARRAGLASERLSDMSRRYADFYRKRFGELSVVGQPEVQDDRAANVLTVTERYRLEAPFDSEGASIRGLTMRADAIVNPAALPGTMQRSGPLHFARQGAYRHEMRVRIPRGWKPTFQQEQDAVDGGAFSYQRELEVGTEEARLVHRLDVQKADVAGSDVTAHIGELREVDDTLSSTLRFRMPQGAAVEDRSRRLRELLRDVQKGGGRP